MSDVYMTRGQFYQITYWSTRRSKIFEYLILNLLNYLQNFEYLFELFNFKFIKLLTQC